MRVLICGSRTWADDFLVYALLDGLMNYYEMFVETEGDEPFTIIHGDAGGADMAAHRAGRKLVPRDRLLRFPADWDLHGKAAGPIRNQRMLAEGKPDVVYAFVDKPLAESRGTADMVRRAQNAGLAVYVIEKK